MMTINGNPAGFIAMIQLAGFKGYLSVHRLVIHPDFQGVGLGKILLDFVTKEFKDKVITLKTSNPALIFMLNRANSGWTMNRHGRKTSSDTDKKYQWLDRVNNRYTASFRSLK